VHLLKALLYKMHLEQRFEEKDINREIKLLIRESEIVKDAAAKSIINSLIAGKYYNFFQQNRWRFYNRTKTVNYIKDDIATWSADDFHKAIGFWYQQSLTSPSVAKQTRIEAFESILTSYNSKVYRPTLYDLLAHRALNYFKSDETYITKPLTLLY
jgi:hypothetical protein